MQVQLLDEAGWPNACRQCSTLPTDAAGTSLTCEHGLTPVISALQAGRQVAWEARVSGDADGWVLPAVLGGAQLWPRHAALRPSRATPAGLQDSSIAAGHQPP